MNKIQTAATLLREIAKNTTDATAFRVEVDKESERQTISLRPDMKRRGVSEYINNGDTFYHQAEVVAVCGALNLHTFISAVLVEGKPEFRACIY